MLGKGVQEEKDDMVSFEGEEKSTSSPSHDKEGGKEDDSVYFSSSNSFSVDNQADEEEDPLIANLVNEQEVEKDNKERRKVQEEKHISKIMKKAMKVVENKSEESEDTVNPVYDGVEFIEGKEDPTSLISKDKPTQSQKKKRKKIPAFTAPSKKQKSITQSLVSVSKEEVFEKDLQSQSQKKMKKKKKVDNGQDVPSFDYLVFVPSSKFSVASTYATNEEEIKVLKKNRLHVKCFTAKTLDGKSIVRVATLNTMTAGKKSKTVEEKQKTSTSRFNDARKLIPAKHVVFIDCEPDHPENKPRGMINVKTVNSSATLKMVVPLEECPGRKKSVVKRMEYLDKLKTRTSGKKQKKRKRSTSSFSSSSSSGNSSAVGAEAGANILTFEEKQELRTADRVDDSNEDISNSEQDRYESDGMDEEGVIREDESDENYAVLERMEAELEKKKKKSVSKRRSNRKRKESKYSYVLDGDNISGISEFESEEFQPRSSSVMLVDEEEEESEKDNPSSDTMAVLPSSNPKKKKRAKKLDTTSTSGGFDFKYYALEACRDMLCKGCKSHARSVGQFPCNHLLYCVMCYAKRANTSSRCLECNTKIEKTVVFHV